MASIAKAIIPIAGLSTRFLPLSKALPKELLPLGGKPMVQYAIEEVKAAGASEIIFIVNTQKKLLGDYLKRAPQLEKLLEERNQQKLVEELRGLDKALEGLSFTFLLDKALGDGHAVLQAKRLVKDEPCFVVYPDDVFEARVPCSAQLEKVFATSQKPVTALCRMPKEKLSSYGVVQAEKIASRLYKIQKIVEKPQQDPPSLLAIAGRRVITPEVFDCLKKAKPNKKGEIVLSEVFGDMVRDGKIVYGYEVEGRWWEAGTKKDWMRTDVYYSLTHPEYGKELREFVRDEKLNF